MDRATWLSWSPNVFMQGRPVCRQTDKMLLNRGNTVSIGGDHEIDLKDANKDAVICAIACLCLNALRGKLASGEQYQTCVNKAVTSAFYKAGYPKRGVNPSLWREVPFDRSNKWSMITANSPNQDLPTSNYIRPNSRRLDLAYVQNGKIETLYDLKFPGDTPLASKDPDRLDDYREIAAKNHATFDEFIVEDRCHHCSDDEGNKKTLLEALGLAILGLIMLLLLRGAPVEDMGPMPGGLEPGMA